MWAPWAAANSTPSSKSSCNRRFADIILPLDRHVRTNASLRQVPSGEASPGLRDETRKALLQRLLFNPGAVPADRPADRPSSQFAFFFGPQELSAAVIRQRSRPSGSCGALAQFLSKLFIKISCPPRAACAAALPDPSQGSSCSPTFAPLSTVRTQMSRRRLLRHATGARSFRILRSGTRTRSPQPT